MKTLTNVAAAAAALHHTLNPQYAIQMCCSTLHLASSLL
jgi:hypothetical protein